MSLRINIRQILAILLLIVGAQFWLVIGHGMWGRDYSKWLPVAIFVICLIPRARSLIARGLDALRNPSPATRRIVTILIAIGATIYFVVTARQQGVEFFPRIHDESSYLIQTRMILHGHLWEQQHPLADFFETFHILVSPVYASKYFPGTALLYAPGLALGLPYWLIPALAAGATVGLVYRVVGELTDGAGGLLAALMMIGCSALRRASVLYMSTAPIMLLTMLAIWAYLHWRRSPKPIWAACIGFLLSWALITRPLDAVCFGIPIGVAMLIDLRRITPRAAVSNLAAAFVATIPLLAIQIVCNVGITGQWNITPWTMYTRHDDPFDGMAIGGALDPSLKSQSTLPQKIEFSEGFTKGAAQQRRAPGRIARFMKDDLNADFDVMLSHALLMILLPVGLLAVRGARGVLFATLPLCLVAYAFYTFSVPQYLVIAAPACALGVVLGIEAIANIFPQISSLARTFLSLSIVPLVFTQLPQFNRFMSDDMFRPSEPKLVAQMLANLDREPAVVLFHYEPGRDNPHIEPVYNTDVAWPDDAPVIRAHDLGSARNVAIYRYYPDRAFYLCDPRFSAPRYLGLGRELAERAGP